MITCADENEAALALQKLDALVRSGLSRLESMDISHDMLADVQDLQSAWDDMCPSAATWVENRGSSVR